MLTFTSFNSTLFDILLWPFGGAQDWHVWVSVIFWSLLFGVVALLAFKYCSNQAGIASAKNGIKVHLYEIRLFPDDILCVLGATVKILGKNLLYIGHNLMPMAVMMIPFLALFTQIVANYALDPMQPGTTTLMKVALDSEHTTAAPGDVRLEVPDGVEIVAGPVRTPKTKGLVAWKLRVTDEGDHTLKIHVGDQVVEKGLAVGGEARKVPVMRTKEWADLLMYPGESTLDGDSPVLSARFVTPGTMVGYPERDLGWMPGGEIGLMAMFLLISIVAGLALKDVFGVTF